MNKHYCTHGTLLSSYCHECTTPEPTTAEATIERVAIEAYSTGYDAGHNDTVESVFCGDSLERATEWYTEYKEEPTTPMSKITVQDLLNSRRICTQVLERIEELETQLSRLQCQRINAKTAAKKLVALLEKQDE